jgi:hypothetical protein
MPDDHPQHYELSEVLATELEAVKPEIAGSPALPAPEGNFVSVRAEMSHVADRVPQVGPGLTGAAWDKAVEERKAVQERERRKVAYRRFHKAELAALCLSGGGIRSASISLGVIQGMADHDLLDKFDYLSTVSGGGYIGSWLSAWLKWSGDPDVVLKGLKDRREDPDNEAEPLRHLRQYSAYLTPQSGILSGDLWAPVAIIIRNLLLNWLILIPALALPVVLAKVMAALVHGATLAPSYAPFVVAVGLLLSVTAFAFKIGRLYAERPANLPAHEESAFLHWSLLPATASAFLVTCMTGLEPPVSPFMPAPTQGAWIVSWQGWLAIAAVGVAIYASACRFLLGRSANSRLDRVGWAIGAVAWGSCVWLGIYLYRKLGAECGWIDRQLLLIILGPAWFLASIFVAQTVYTLLRSYSPKGDFEREWLGRAGGWYLLAALGWIVFTTIVLIGPILFRHADETIAYGKTWLTALGAISGAATAFLGRSSLTGADAPSSNWSELISNVGLKVAGPLFAAILLILLSVAFDAIALDQPFEISALRWANDTRDAAYGSDWIWTVGVLVMLVVVMLLADRLVNVNRYSLHAVYRNRLVRCYLGGPHAIVKPPAGKARKPDGFTGFDENDNIRLTDIWPGPRTADRWRPYHVINMTLNLASTKNLAWQERKAMSFVATPQFCGAADLGFRPTAEFGDPKADGISLGTAMAISGAAINSNMGYHTSPTIAFLLTLLNVRLGWWLGNPGKAGAGTYREDGPRFALPPLLSEMFERTNEDSPYVYLSDGGHFEDFGLYEMVRRRCRLIVIVDGGQDAERGFEDLGNAVRKIWIDLGVRITFDRSKLLQAEKDAKSAGIPYFAVGTVTYVSDPPIAVQVDGGTEQKVPEGKILYLKPVVRGDEDAADVIAYKRANADFPDQTTLNQWFDESQLESYRRLGHLMVDRIVRKVPYPFNTTNPTLEGLIVGAAKLNQETMSWP